MNKRALNRFNRIQENIRLAQSRITSQEQAIPLIESSNVSPETLEKCYQEIEEGKKYIASLAEILRVEYPQEV